MGEGGGVSCVPIPTGGGRWREPMPPPPKLFCFYFGSQYREFWYIMDLFLHFSYLFHAQNQYRRIQAVMVSRWNSPILWSLHFLRTFTLGWTKMCSFIVYRLTFRWPKSNSDVDICTSKYYLLLALVCWTWTCEPSGWVYLTSSIPLVKITFYYDYRWCAFLIIFFPIDDRTTFPLFKKERERRSRAFPSDSNPEPSPVLIAPNYGRLEQLRWSRATRYAATPNHHTVDCK